MTRKIRKVGEQGPYGTRGRGHATLHRDMAFRHEDHSKCPAGCRAACRPHLMIAPADAAAQSVNRGGFGGPRRPATAPQLRDVPPVRTHIGMSAGPAAPGGGS